MGRQLVAVAGRGAGHSLLAVVHASGVLQFVILHVTAAAGRVSREAAANPGGHFFFLSFGYSNSQF